MRDNSKDSIIERNYIRNWQHLCEEYETVKAGKHPKFRRRSRVRFLPLCGQLLIIRFPPSLAKFLTPNDEDFSET